MTQPLLSRDQINAAKDRREETIDVPEWGGSVRLVQMTAAESIQLTKDMAKDPDLGIFIVLVYSALDADNKRIFTPDDIEMLRLKNFNVLNMLQRRALALNAQTDAQKEALKKA